MTISSRAAGQRYCSAAEVANLLGISRWTVDEWIQKGILPQPVRPGGPRGKRLWPCEVIERLLGELNGVNAS